MQLKVKALKSNQLIRAIENFDTSLENEPMFDNTLRIYKNMTNTIGLEVKRIDRKYLLLTSDKTYYINLIDPKTEDFILRTEAKPVNIEKGRMNIVISAAHLENVVPGFYRYSITYKDEFDSEHYLYITSDYEATAFIEILDNALPSFKESLVIENFLETRQDDLVQTINRLSRMVNNSAFSFTNKNSIRTFVIYTNEYTGKVILQGSMDEQPNNNSDWYDIREIEFEESTETIGYNIEGFHTWIRFKLEYDSNMEGDVDKILYR